MLPPADTSLPSALSLQETPHLLVASEQDEMQRVRRVLKNQALPQADADFIKLTRQFSQPRAPVAVWPAQKLLRESNRPPDQLPLRPAQRTDLPQHRRLKGDGFQSKVRGSNLPSYRVMRPCRRAVALALD